VKAATLHGQEKILIEDIAPPQFSPMSFQESFLRA
jgi:hypothetical protein